MCLPSWTEYRSSCPVFPGAALKKCHWISIWAFSLLQSATDTLKAVCAGLSTKPCSWCVFTTPLFRMRNVNILHLPLFLLCAHVCLGESLFCHWLLWGHCKNHINHQICLFCFHECIHLWSGHFSFTRTVVKSVYVLDNLSFFNLWLWFQG